MILLILAGAIMAATFIPWAIANDNADELYTYETYEQDPTLNERNAA
jgi:hypothetical protein